MLRACVSVAVVQVFLASGIFCSESGLSVTRLTFSEPGARSGQGFWSPDGGQVSFVSNRSGSWQVWVMGKDGSLARRLTDHAAPVGWPSWWDAERILFYGGTEGGFRIFSVRLSDSRVERLIDGEFQDFRPTMSPDGSQILFDRYGASDPPNHDLHVLDVGAGSIRRLTSDPGYDSDARWAPDGRWIVFHSDRAEPAMEPLHTQIFVIGADGGGLKQLTRGDARNAYPAWSPDGSCIVYTSEADGNRDVWVMKSDGTGAGPLTASPGFDGDPAWSPAGKAILFATDRFPDAGVELALIDVSGMTECGGSHLRPVAQ